MLGAGGLPTALVALLEHGGRVSQACAEAVAEVAGVVAVWTLRVV